MFLSDSLLDASRNVPKIECNSMECTQIAQRASYKYNGNHLYIRLNETTKSDYTSSSRGFLLNRIAQFEVETCAHIDAAADVNDDEWYFSSY